MCAFLVKICLIFIKGWFVYLNLIIWKKMFSSSVSFGKHSDYFVGNVTSPDTNLDITRHNLNSLSKPKLTRCWTSIWNTFNTTSTSNTRISYIHQIHPITISQICALVWPIHNLHSSVVQSTVPHPLKQCTIHPNTYSVYHKGETNPRP